MNGSDFTHRVCEAYSKIENPRVNALVQSLIKHLHAYVQENSLTEKEWEFTWDFLARMAKFTHEERNEFLLAADVLGVSQLIEILNHHRPESEVGYALVGPFYRENAPFRARGAAIASDDTAGIRVKIYGKVIDDSTGKPIANAVLDTWQAATNGLYETQDPNQPDMNLRGKFKTDENGNYELVALMPTPYPVPTDGPVGELLKVAHRHPLRPAHIHFIVSASNYETLITQIFVSGDDIVKTDVVFTASDNMMGNFVKENDHYELQYDFQLTLGISTYPEAPIK
ncbi:MAG: protocatechuate 3,4-dioxygenase beta subunit [Gammaproteobacteria bacterium]|jgi:catechol 1,2-dioxygenase|nr:protocatechuate 3,4-dioxygenase beta subunit [Gammaproteobacteria bacterium]